MRNTLIGVVTALSACAVPEDPSEGVTTQNICAMDEDGNWCSDCGSSPGGGGGGPNGESCANTSCEQQWECQFACLNPLAVCVHFPFSGVSLGWCVNVQWTLEAPPE
jgi:hypothetical protein